MLVQKNKEKKTAKIHLLFDKISMKDTVFLQSLKSDESCYLSEAFLDEFKYPFYNHILKNNIPKIRITIRSSFIAK